MKDAELFDALLRLRNEVAAGAGPIMVRSGADTSDAAQVNLANYLALRHVDVRPLQRELAWRGLSSLGRLESRVLPTIDATLAALARLTGRSDPFATVSAAAFFAGETLLDRRAAELFGPAHPSRRTRIAVTLGREATDRSFVAGLAAAGMDVARINCAHDDETVWRAMAENVRETARASGRQVPILFDIGGPKVRTGHVAASARPSRLQVGDLLRLVAGPVRLDETARFCASVSLPEILTRLSVGDRVGYNDGKLNGVVESTTQGEALVRVVAAEEGGVHLKPEKGLNFPDTDLGLSPLTAQDRVDLRVVVECADLVGYSFVSLADDVDLLEAAIAELEPASQLGLILKLELPQSVANLPQLIARASRHRRFGVMIARGDLAAEIGFERLAEIQEEILWVCEAASVPVIWATQVLDDLARTGVPSRGEMTDAAMASRAECVMLNKGPAILKAVGVLDRLLGRMDEHMTKKTPTLRPLKSW